MVLKELDDQPVQTRDIDMRKMLVQAAKRVKSRASSTFTAVIYDPDEQTLKGINHGDSGFMLIRKYGHDYHTVFKSSINQYKFNHPAQIGSIYKQPYYCDTFSLKVQHNDIIVMATDGLWDNMSAE